LFILKQLKDNTKNPWSKSIFLKAFEVQTLTKFVLSIITKKLIILVQEFNFQKKVLN